MKSVNLLLVALIGVAITCSSADPLLPSPPVNCRIQPNYTEDEAVDLGLDFSNNLVSWDLREALAETVLSDDPSNNQETTETTGHPRMLDAVVKLYSNLTNIPLDPLENVIITVGATEALVAAFHSLTQEGDEWIMIEPFWSSYKSQIKLTPGIFRFTNLKLKKTTGDITSSDWEFDREEFESLFNNKTRGILLTNPNNPSGRVYSREELQFIADLAEKWNVTVIADEVYEWAVYEPLAVTKFVTLPGMFKRTLTIGSASKAFIASGWRTGWVFGPANLISLVLPVHTALVRTASIPQQIAVAYGLEQEYLNYGKPTSYFQSNLLDAKVRRDFTAAALRRAGMIPIVPDGGFCMMATWPELENYKSISGNFADWLISHVGVLGLAISEYYGDEHSSLGDKYIRFCYHKNNETLQSAADLLMRLRCYDTTTKYLNRDFNSI